MYQCSGMNQTFLLIDHSLSCICHCLLAIKQSVPSKKPWPSMPKASVLFESITAVLPFFHFLESRFATYHFGLQVTAIVKTEKQKHKVGLCLSFTPAYPTYPHLCNSSFLSFVAIILPLFPPQRTLLLLVHSASPSTLVIIFSSFSFAFPCSLVLFLFLSLSFLPLLSLLSFLSYFLHPLRLTPFPICAWPSLIPFPVLLPLP